MDWFRFLRAVLSETWYSFPKNLLNNFRMLGPLGGCICEGDVAIPSDAVKGHQNREQSSRDRPVINLCCTLLTVERVTDMCSATIPLVSPARIIPMARARVILREYPALKTPLLVA